MGVLEMSCRRGQLARLSTTTTVRLSNKTANSDPEPHAKQAQTHKTILPLRKPSAARTSLPKLRNQTRYAATLAPRAT